MDLGEIGYENVDWIEVAQYKKQRWVVRTQ